MHIQKIIKSKDFLLVTYKLLHDALFLVLATFALTLIAEGLLPGIISSHISMARIAILIFVLLGAIVWIGNKLEIVYDAPKIKSSKFLPPLILFSFLLIGNSMLKFALWENIIITLTTLFIFFLFYNLFFSKTE
jgi:hypothetical protein